MALPLPSTSTAGSAAFHTVPPPPLPLLPLRAIVKAFVQLDGIILAPPYTTAASKLVPVVVGVPVIEALVVVVAAVEVSGPRHVTRDPGGGLSASVNCIDVL